MGKNLHHCEKNEEKLDAQRSEILNVLWAETMAQSEHDWFQMANSKLDIYENSLLSSCRRLPSSSRSFSQSFMNSFFLITTIGFNEGENFTSVGKIFTILYATFGIPLALLYLNQCSKMISGLLPGDRVIFGAVIVLFFNAIVYDIAQKGTDDTPFIDAVYQVFLTLSTIGSCNFSFTTIFALISLCAISLMSISFVFIQRRIELLLQNYEILFAKNFAIIRRWIAKEVEDTGRIIEEDAEESETEEDEDY
ncbi:unnamed protein product [Dracunculus medinensis]|uniref:Ion_trans_2 domain-containing protein n=1 Tax=Dracunculus medinensis TaxID=318479 RepID=A0A0N4U536_DRAME|nr:unnamed protein product [Dracunculus medinensis]